MRVISGAWRGRPIVAPAGQATRPTSDRAREGLFSMLASRIGSFEGLQAADLFAGSGALGLEALSRGAGYCTFIDSDRDAVAAIRRNLDTLKATDRAEVRAFRAETAPPPPQPCDAIFLDPPYGGGLAETTLAHLDRRWIAPGGWISVETAAELHGVPRHLEIAATRRFGKALITLLHHAS